MTSTAEMMAKIRGARATYARNDTKVVKLKEGKTRVRILQKPGDENFKFWHDLGVHWIKDDPNGKPLAVIGCSDACFEEPSQINTLIDKVIQSAPDDETVALAKSWRAKKSVLVQALIRSGDAKSETPVVLELTRTTFDQVLSAYENFYEENSASILDPNDGLDFVIERKGKGLDTEYLVTQTSKAVPVPKAALDAMIDLGDFIRKEYFRPGDEAKAIGAITRMTGVTVAGGLPAARATAGLLTGSGSRVVDADIDEDVVEELSTKPSKAAAAKPAEKTSAKTESKDDFDEDLDVEGVLNELEELD